LEETYPKNIIIGEENGENKKEAKSRENQKGWKISEKPT
jgi:fructose-1,6-bisphosphatase/inositol monophosphatase family enzyme